MRRFISRSIIEYARDLTTSLPVTQFGGKFALRSSVPSSRYVFQMDTDSAKMSVISSTPYRHLFLSYSGIFPSILLEEEDVTMTQDSEMVYSATHSELVASETPLGVDISKLSHGTDLEEFMLESTEFREVPVSILSVEYMSALMSARALHDWEGYLWVNTCGTRIWYRGIGVETFWTDCDDTSPYVPVPVPAIYFTVILDGEKSASRQGLEYCCSGDILTFRNMVSYGKSFVWKNTDAVRIPDGKDFLRMEGAVLVSMFTVDTRTISDEDIPFSCRMVKLQSNGNTLMAHVFDNKGKRTCLSLHAPFAEGLNVPLRLMHSERFLDLIREKFRGTLSVYLTKQGGHMLVFETTVPLHGLFSLARPTTSETRPMMTRVYFEASE